MLIMKEGLNTVKNFIKETKDTCGYIDRDDILECIDLLKYSAYMTKYVVKTKMEYKSIDRSNEILKSY